MTDIELRTLDSLSPSRVRDTSLTRLVYSEIFSRVTKDVTLPSSVTTIKFDVFADEDNPFLGDHAYIVVPAGRVLSIGKGKGVIADNGKADLVSYLFDDPANRVSSNSIKPAMSELSGWQGGGSGR